MRKVIFVVVASASAIAAQAASAQGQTVAAPTQAPPTTIVYSDKGPNGMSDVPMGVHRIPDSNVVISGHQKGGIGFLFGVVGLLAQSAANTQTGTGKVRNVQDDLRFDVTAKAGELTATILADDRYRQLFALSPQPGAGTLTVVPYVVITFEGENEIRPYVALKTKLNTGAPGESPKTIKYFCCEGKPLPLTGENGLAENGGARLKEMLTAELETAIHVMLQDRSQPYPRNDQAKIAVNGYLPFVGKPMKFKGYDLGRYNDYSLIEFRSGALVFGGVNIAEPSSLEIKPANVK
ncbi:MAG: hypothetical protein WC804_14540 [Sphingomonas sp.]|jgi:hypothetical protein|uniref:hypothetical protein n=1 Tax=Sphingomonas sp. TaxID=28214 RepID=UPI00356B25A5